MNFDILDYLNPIKKWWWLIIISTVIAGGTSFLFARQQPDIYQTQVTMVVGQTINDPNPSSSQISLERQLTETYVNIALMNTIKSETMEALGLDWLPEYTAYSVTNSQLLVIEVTDTDPARAQIVANEISRQLIINSPTMTDEEDYERTKFINTQLDYFEKQITQAQADITTLTEEISTYLNASQITQAETELAALELKLRTLQTTYTELLNNTQDEAINIISVIEPADIPVVPVGPNRMLLTGVAAIGGMMISIFGALLIEQLSTTLESIQDLEKVIETPVIGIIPDIKDKKIYEFLANNPEAKESENFRTLRTNIHFMNINKPYKSLLVSSPGIGDGKTSTAINLAFIEAQTQKSVILVDADLRNPDVYKILQEPEMENLGDLMQDVNVDWDVFVPFRRGLSDIFLGMSTVQDAIVQYKDTSLYVLPSGTPPPNPAELLSSEKMKDIMEILTRRFDLVILDAPPFLVSDASILSSYVDGLIGVVQPGKTTEPEIINMKEQIRRIGGNLVGIVMNKSEAHLGGQYTQHYSYYPAQRKKKPSLIRRVYNRLFRKESDILTK